MKQSLPHIFFAEPPSEEAKGGVDLAMRTVEAHLRRSGEGLTRNADLDDIRKGPEPRLVHFHGLWQFRHGWMSHWCREHDVPYVVSPHGMLEPWAWAHKKWKKWPYYHLVERFHLQGAERVLATSALEAEHLAAFVPEEQICTIPLAVMEDAGPCYESARQERGWKTDETVLVYLSRLHEKKGMHVLLKSLAALPSSRTHNLRLVVVGDGPPEYRDRLRRIEREHTKDLPPVDWMGGVWGEERWSYLQGADLFCLPTHSENFGLVVLEACQVGTPVLTTTGTPWGFLEEWDSGVIAEAEVSSVRAALERYLSSFSWTDTDRRQLAERTRDRFGLNTVGPQYAELYRRVASAPCGGEVA